MEIELQVIDLFMINANMYMCNFISYYHVIYYKHHQLPTLHISFTIIILVSILSHHLYLYDFICRLASLHSYVTKAADYDHENKWTFLTEVVNSDASTSDDDDDANLHHYGL